jgi:hypothetical protein
MLKASPEWLRSAYARLTFKANVRNLAAFRCLEAIGHQDLATDRNVRQVRVDGRLSGANAGVGQLET